MAGFVRSLRPALRLMRSPALARSYAEAAPVAKDMPLVFASGNKVFYNEDDVKQIDVPSFSGAFGILPKHVPTIAVLKPGVVTVFEKDGSTKKIFVSSGTITVNDDSSVQILAEEAHLVESLDISAARETLQKAQSELSSASTPEAKEEAAIAVEVAESIVKSCE